MRTARAILCALLLGTTAAPVWAQTVSLFVPGDEAALIARRTARLALLPPAPTPPTLAEAGTHPIDRFLLAGQWKEEPDTDSWKPCGDAVFVRRVYLDLIGVGPTLEESARFIADPSPDKRARLIDALLARNGDYADHWTPWWEDALASNPAASTGGMTSRGSYTEFVRKAFTENRPFDVFVAQLLDPSLPGYKKPEVGSDNGRALRAHLVLNATPSDRLQTAAVIGQVFMGTAMKCATCHNHFENTEWPQDRFYGFAAYFGAGDMEVVRCERRLGRTVGAAFPFEIAGAPAAAPADENGRATLVSQLLVDPLNPRFAGSIVNRLWKRYFGLGLIEPADDWRLEWPPSNPELLDWLADDFVRSGYDLKHTTRMIMTSRAYQAAYDPALEDTFDTADPASPRLFRSPRLRRLTAEQFIDTLRVCTEQALDPGKRLYRSPDSTGLSRSLGKPALRNEISTGRSDQTSVVQGLELLNGPEFSGLFKGGLIERAVGSPSAGDAAVLIYRAMLCREPSAAEREAVAAYLGEKVTPEGVQDVLWSIASGPEFAFIR